ncbi:helix-turn-helix domain-containing protein [Rhodococcus sp. NCIMB 12038]|uniref:helix-turn-helix domain-containing protein n=1 Tax=Rhodococcus sp. NCIMB 12038 TaxID=933800 RepID=UPI000B3D1B7C|nr:helix-turn-helix transcriptional regulator [Rhodococcus sp. NCIMB 12038]OUS94597.1 transcriptional regulator [Rhodococcus sp. NCIMB 12038]
MTSPQEDFGPWLAQKLRATGSTQAQHAEAIGVTRAAVSAWISGRSEPSDQMRAKIATALDVDLESMESSGAAAEGISAKPQVRAGQASGPPTLQWHHRPAHTDGGREYGNAAAFAFNADLSVLAREATQNSLDERLNLTAPVRVAYTLHELTGDALSNFLTAIHWSELSPHFDSAAAGGQKVARSLRAALNDLEERGSIVLLRIDDFNAAGLTGPEYDDGRFAAVVRRQLDSHKQSAGRAGGSYGIGKATLWATSRFGLVLANSTLSTPHEGRTDRRVVGRLDLPWHEIGGSAYAGPAWFGEEETDADHNGVSRSWWADDEQVHRLRLDRRSCEPGTSFLIVGAHDASGDAETLHEMHEKLVRALADGFWAAMVCGASSGPFMEARVTAMRNDEVVIAEQRVDPHEFHPALNRALRAYLDDDTVNELTSAEQVARATVPLIVTPRRDEGRGRAKGLQHDAVLLVTPADESATTTNRVVCMRGNRMTIVEHRPREIPLGTPPFQAVLLAGYATGHDDESVEAAEAFLRASEPPEHDKWDRTEELTSSYEKGALTRLKEFRSAVDQAVRGLVGQQEAERDRGPKVLRDLLKLDAPPAVRTRSIAGAASVRHVQGRVDESGAWVVTVTVKVPESEMPWLLTPVAKFEVRSGGRPTVRWAELTATENCRVDGSDLMIEAGIRQAAFIGITDPATHPVQGKFARLIVELPKSRGGSS